MNAAVAPTPDTQPPTPPTNLAATAASTSQINVSWTASTDTVGVTGYQVEHCQDAGCTNFLATGPVVTGTSDSDTGLSAGTTDEYTAEAKEEDGNLSHYSAIARPTTPPPDTQPPTPPTLPTRRSSDLSQINVSWTASTDDVGVTGYQVERCQGAGCTNFSATGPIVTGTSYSDTGLSAN